MAPTVRKLSGDDSALARALVQRFHATSLPEEHFASLLADPRELLIVAEADGELEGFAWAHWLPRLRLESRQLFLYEIEVAAESQRTRRADTRVE